MAPRKKHIPQRTCIACRTVRHKRDMVRIVKTVQQTIVVDETGKAQGRGAYICLQETCWQTGLRQGILGRALKTTISSDDMAALEKYAARFSQRTA